MQIDFAPLEGITDAVFRRVHHACFGGVDRYFIPFIAPTQNMRFSSRELAAIAPEVNAGVNVVPQILAKDAGLFAWAAQQLADMGYDEINLNLGCPSGTVTAKGKGSGMLANLDALKRFLDAAFASVSVKLSIKTRIGFESVEEWPDILAVLSQYPASELIVHPRVRSEFYKGLPHWDAFSYALQHTRVPLVYNGDLFDMEECEKLRGHFPELERWMMGRGLVANPALAQELNGGAGATNAALKSFHDRLYAEYGNVLPKNARLMRMQAIMQHISCCFEDADRPMKAVRKAKNDAAYLAAVDRLFGECTLRELPGYRL